jgi:hypothetical protein
MGGYYYDQVEKVFVKVMGFPVGVDHDDGSHAMIRYQRLHPETELPVGPEMVRSFASWMALDEYRNGSPRLDFRFAPAELVSHPVSGSDISLRVTEDHEIG